jgi:diketogulonate reductase-like aldo/keto reductase
MFNSPFYLDGFRTKDEDGAAYVTKRHTNVKQAMRNGIVTTDQADNYRDFKQALRDLCSNAPNDSLFCNTMVEELDSREGYGFALRHALRHCVSTDYVCVIQHDRTFMRPTPLQETMKAMWNNRNIKYVGVSKRVRLAGFVFTLVHHLFLLL